MRSEEDGSRGEQLLASLQARFGTVTNDLLKWHIDEQICQSIRPALQA